MRPDRSTSKNPDDRHGRRHQTWSGATPAKSPPRTWNSKTMHHPATRIGEIKHGKS